MRTPSLLLTILTIFLAGTTAIAEEAPAGEAVDSAFCFDHGLYGQVTINESDYSAIPMDRSTITVSKGKVEVAVSNDQGNVKTVSTSTSAACYYFEEVDTWAIMGVIRLDNCDHDFEYRRGPGNGKREMHLTRHHNTFDCAGHIGRSKNDHDDKDFHLGRAHGED